MIQLYVGTDPQQHVAEKALENSVRLNTSVPVNIHWMRSGDASFERNFRADGEATPFTLYRWAVPRFAGYQGRAIYLDVDMLVLGDLLELWEWPLNGVFWAMTKRPDVIVWECGKCPKVDTKAHLEAARRAAYQGIKPASRLPSCWDHMDKLHEDTKLLHFTEMETQPWQPYKERFKYRKKHPDPNAVELFWEYATC